MIDKEENLNVAFLFKGLRVFYSDNVNLSLLQMSQFFGYLKPLYVCSSWVDNLFSINTGNCDHKYP
jgi:hypothetical protein